MGNGPKVVGIAIAGFICLVTAVHPGRARADENLWGYVQGTDVLPKGATELYHWMTYRTGKDKGTYRAWDYMLELEHGFTDRLEGAVYLKGRTHTIDGGALPEDPTREVHRGPEFNGVNLEVKYNVLSVYKDPVGLSLYLEPEYSTISKVSGERVNEVGFESKLLLQKNFFEDQLAVAYNFMLEPEWEQEKGHANWERELGMEHTAGVSYRFLPGWFAGIEGRYHAVYPDFNGPSEGAYFIGPNIHYAAERWWVTFTFLPQVYGHPNTPGRRSGFDFNEHEQYEFRLKFAYSF